MKNDRPEWFAPRRLGYGAGLPIRWQGWLVLGLYLAVVLGAAVLLGDRPAALLALVVPATMLFMIVCARTTRGGWRWRWGR
jgi:hypothetical protein